jgi:hypothetical protein
MTAKMKRRAFIALIGGAAAAWPLAVRAQQPPAVQRIGYLSDESRSLGLASFELIAKPLRELGYVEGRNIVFESRYADGKNDLLPDLAAELAEKADRVLAAELGINQSTVSRVRQRSTEQTHQLSASASTASAGAALAVSCASLLPSLAGKLNKKSLPKARMLDAAMGF